ncbi:hypothetical protein LCGC14_1160570 [marine sediment metagenome]|uniref:Uncharacterized protein n=1 Tax=marine sediment metagenome TaxID=412755 RepID=A0A0F9PB22_9ZZZZ
MFDKTKPLWLPFGSVRALMFMAVVGTILYEIIGGGGLTDELMIILVGVLGSYGLMRYKQAEVKDEPFTWPVTHFSGDPDEQENAGSVTETTAEEADPFDLRR